MKYNIIEISEMIEKLQDFACNENEQVFYCGGIVGTDIFRYVARAAILARDVTKEIMFIDGCQDNVVLNRNKPIRYLYYRDLFFDLITLSSTDTFAPNFDPVQQYVSKVLDKEKFFGVDVIVINNAQLIEYEYLDEILKQVTCKVFVVSDPFDVGGFPFSVYPTITDSLSKQNWMTAYSRRLYGVESRGIEKRFKCGITKIKLAKRSYGRMDMTQHITNNPVVLKEVNDKQRNSPLKKNQKFIITDKRSSMSYKGNQPGESNFHTGTIMTLDNNTGDLPLFRMHNCQLVQRFNITYEQTSKLYAGTNVNPANMISVEDAVFHRFRDTTFVYDQNISLDIRYRYSLIKNTVFLRVIEI